jgi:hypothetical protein
LQRSSGDSQPFVSGLFEENARSRILTTPDPSFDREVRTGSEMRHFLLS